MAISERTYTLREKVLAEREAFKDGVNMLYWYWQGEYPKDQSAYAGVIRATEKVAARYPLPKVTRPRRVTLSYGVTVFMPDGARHVGTVGGGFRVERDENVLVHYGNILALRQYIGTLDDVRLINGLLNSPTEEVEAES